MVKDVMKDAYEETKRIIRNASDKDMAELEKAGMEFFNDENKLTLWVISAIGIGELIDAMHKMGVSPATSEWIAMRLTKARICRHLSYRL